MADIRSKYAPAVIVGAVAGAVAALLLSPKSGKENREAVAKSLADMKDKLNEQEFTNTLKDIFTQAQDKSGRLYTRARTELDSRLEEFSDYLDKKRYEQVVDDVIAKLRSRSKQASDKIDEVRSSLMNEWDDRKKHFLSKSRSTQTQ